ncbi:MAG: hypothetical protein MPW17_04755 [Candidatus Manganitrophus sp.]|nr:hypothetical protein [Candidatus Manganitrophus sp.]WDT72153.1 MAG: hypothetical protein MPW17_04755 [Candidatus Manganitrophus sp.]
MKKKTIRVDHLARVEGEGALTVTIKDGQVVDARLQIFEPPASSKPSCEGGVSPRPETSPPGSAGSAPSPIR